MQARFQSFLEKTFFYGGLIWLATAAGTRLPVATGAVALSLFGMSVAAHYAFGRSAETTDALLAVFIGTMMLLLPRHLPSHRTVSA